MTGMGFFQKTPLWFKRTFFWLVDRLVWVVAERPLNRLRHHLGLPAWQNFYEEGLHGGIGGIAMFPDWFASRNPIGPLECGPSISSESGTTPFTPELDAFLSSGKPR